MYALQEQTSKGWDTVDTFATLADAQAALVELENALGWQPGYARVTEV